MDNSVNNNKKTNELKNHNNNEESKKADVVERILKDPLAFNITGKRFKTPAQDRLKRIQHNIKTMHAARNISKHLHQYHPPNENHNQIKHDTNHNLQSIQSTPLITDDVLGEPPLKKSKVTEMRKMSVDCAVQSLNVPKTSDDNISTNNELSTDHGGGDNISFVSRVKRFCTRAFLSCQTVETTKKTETDVQENKDECDKVDDDANAERPFNTLRRSNENTRMNASTPKRRKAQERLDRIRQFLIQNPACTRDRLPEFNVYKTPRVHSSVPCRSEIQDNNNELTNQNDYMDWQPINPETLDEYPNINTSYSPQQVTKGKENCIHAIDKDGETMADLYDTVNENLLRIYMDNEDYANNVQNKWLKDHYYFILDTNVLLRHLTFIDDLRKMKLCVTKGTIIFIPYCVLQELDHIKLGMDKHDHVKTLAIRAIKYLNEKFETKSRHLKAQSALEEKEHLIKIVSPDDHIINCCLQVMRKVSNVILLTEDTNLRNKAICNNITATTKSDLLAKKYNTSFAT